MGSFAQRVPRPRTGGRLNNVRGLTLIELVVTVAIISILAAVAVPYAEVSVRRGKEMELRRNLRDIRTAIDAFHADWEKGLIPAIADLASIDGYPRTLDVLIHVRLADGREHRYLRRIPRDPLAPGEVEAGATWRLMGYRDAPDSDTWGGEDVWDVISTNTGTALDGSRYRDW